MQGKKIGLADFGNPCIALSSILGNGTNSSISSWRSTSTLASDLIILCTSGRSFIYLLLYVDDLLIESKSNVDIDKLKVQLRQEFEMKGLGEARRILGVEIKRDRSKGMVWSS